MSQSRRDFLKSSGLVIMAGAAGYLGTEQFVRGQFANYGASHPAPRPIRGSARHSSPSFFVAGQTP